MFSNRCERLWKYITMLNEFELRSAAVDQRKCNTLSKRQNCKQYQTMQVFFTCLHCPKEKYHIFVYTVVYKVACLCYIPSKPCFEEMRFLKEEHFSLQSIHFHWVSALGLKLEKQNVLKKGGGHPLQPKKLLSFTSWWLLLS